ncbi:MAG: exported protein [Rhizobium sp.]|nr:exported protein [Rhizobium sp.]
MRRIFQHFNKSAVAALFLFVLASATAFSATFGTESLVIRTKAGQQLTFTVELAVAADQRQQGLMNRDQMAADRGMLFDFGETRRVYMWMKNTYLPLDMLFIGPDGKIALIKADTMPLSEEIIDSHDPVRFVLELNAGTAQTLGIAQGDMIESNQIAAVAKKP